MFYWEILIFWYFDVLIFFKTIVVWIITLKYENYMKYSWTVWSEINVKFQKLNSVVTIDWILWLYDTDRTVDGKYTFLVTWLSQGYASIES